MYEYVLLLARSQPPLVNRKSRVVSDDYEPDDIEPDIIDWYLVNLAAENIDFSACSPMLRLAWALLVWKEWLRDANARQL